MSNSFKETALCAVNLGKDTDTVGAIACGLGGLYYGYQEIPAEWLDEIQRKDEIVKMCLKTIKKKKMEKHIASLF